MIPDELITNIASALDNIADTTLPMVDFDTLRNDLKSLLSSVELFDTGSANENNSEDLKQLRADYEGRMAGMVKAMAAVDRKHDSYTETLDFIERLPELSVVRLIEQYRRVSARFRDTFPLHTRQGFSHRPANT